MITPQIPQDSNQGNSENYPAPFIIVAGLSRQYKIYTDLGERDSSVSLGFARYFKRPVICLIRLFCSFWL